MATQASAPGKIILFGEHAVVYGQPALAVPVTDKRVQATASLAPNPSPEGSRGIWIDARDLGRRYRVEDAPPNDPLAAAIRLFTERYGIHTAQYTFTITLDSTIPMASGLGSGAAVCTAIVRALANQFNYPIANSEISAIVFETEKLLHGTPSGIDNTVIAFGQPVFFIKGQPPESFTVAHPFRLLIGDTGISSPTKITVGDVRAAWEKEPGRFNALFAEIGQIVRAAREIIETPVETLRATSLPGQRLGELMNRNHALLREMNVSCAELDALVDAARNAGALGAKLSGAGRGGNMIALVTPETEDTVRSALEKAGAKRVISTLVETPRRGVSTMRNA